MLELTLGGVVEAYRDLSQLVEAVHDCYQRHRRAADIASRIEQLIKPWVMYPQWIEEKYLHCETDEDIYPLYEEGPDDLLMCVICWKQGEPGCIHDHQTWAVIGVAQGSETHTLFKQVDTGTQHEILLERERSVILEAGNTLVMPDNGIHQVCNDSREASTVALHVYGAHLAKIGRHRYDPERGTRHPLYSLK